MARKRRAPGGPDKIERKHLIAAWWGVFVVVEEGFRQPPQPPEEIKEMSPRAGMAALLEWCDVQDRENPMNAPFTWRGEAEKAARSA